MAYIYPGGDSMEKSSMFILTDEQKKSFENELIIAVYMQLYENNFLSAFQLRALLGMHRK